MEILTEKNIVDFIKYSAGLKKAHRVKYIFLCVIPLQPGIRIVLTFTYIHVNPMCSSFPLPPCSRYDESPFFYKNDGYAEM